MFPFFWCVPLHNPVQHVVKKVEHRSQCRVQPKVVLGGRIWDGEQSSNRYRPTKVFGGGGTPGGGSEVEG